MKNLPVFYVIAVLSALLGSSTAFGQSPGRIVRPAVSPYSSVLNPNQNGFTSASTSGFSTNDVSQSEIPFKVVPPAVIEPTGDLATGPSGGFTDIVKTVDNSGFYVYVDASNNILFRLRIGGISSGSKGYSVLIDTDNKMGNSGPNADSNYVAPTNTSNGNPGFEYEVVLQTNFQVAVYNVDGKSNPGSPIATYPLSSHSQISVALSTDGNNPDYFYDWYVPLTVIGSPASIRMAVTTVTSPNSALQGSRSDIYGIDDAANSSVANAWTSVVNAEPAISITSIRSGGTGVGATCTAPPTINTPVIIGASVPVSGMWTRLDASKPSTATITLHKNGVAAGTSSVTSGGMWTITVPTISAGDVFYAKALAAGESECLQSENVYVAACTTAPSAPILSCASSKGITGTLVSPANTVTLYTLSSTVPTPAIASYPVTYTGATFYYASLDCKGSGNALAAGSYMLIANNGSCASNPVFVCINSAGGGITSIGSNNIGITSPVYPFQTTIKGTGATSGEVLRLFVNGKYVSSITATETNFSFTGLSLKASDTLKIYAQSGTNCMTASSTTSVSCYNQPPVITTDASGRLLTIATSISGTSSPNASVTLHRTSPTTASWTTTANSSGAWTVSGLTLTGGDTYTAVVSSSAGCSTASVASSSASVVAPTTICPVITSNPTENSSSVSGTITTSSTGTIRLYLDDVLEGSYTVTSTGTSSWTISSLPYVLYNGGMLKATFQAGSNAENTGCGTVTVSCTSPSAPLIQSITPGTTINAGQSISLSLSNIVPNTWYAVLDDAGKSYALSVYTGSSANLNLPTNNFNVPGDYNLKVTADKLTGCPAGFATTAITVKAISLPVTFLGVNAKQNNSGTLLTWLVSNETNVFYYEVEKSLDCRTFSLLKKVDYKPATVAVNTYSLEDNVWTGQGVCYRIKQVDINGRYQYSSVVYAGASRNGETIVAPNPATDHIGISLSSQTKEPVTIQLLDITGKIVYQTKTNLLQGTNAISIHNLGGLGRGQYVVKLRRKSGEEHYKIILQ